MWHEAAQTVLTGPAFDAALIAERISQQVEKMPEPMRQQLVEESKRGLQRKDDALAQLAERARKNPTALGSALSLNSACVACDAIGCAWGLLGCAWGLGFF